MNYKILSVETGEQLYDFSAATDIEAIEIFYAKAQKWADNSGEDLTREYALKEAISEEYERHVTTNEPRFKTISEDEFDENFTLVKNHILNDPEGSWDGCMFETYGEEYGYVKEYAKEHPKNIWTIIEGDDGTYIASGFHFVNRMGYLITEETPYMDMEVKIDFE